MTRRIISISNFEGDSKFFLNGDSFMTPEQIQATLRKDFPGAEVTVRDLTGAGDHFDVVIVAPQFEEKGLVERHQMVYGSLRNAMDGEIHALSLKTLSPSERDQEN